MRNIENNFELPQNLIDIKLADLEVSSRLSVENMEGLFRCSHFFETRNNPKSEKCMSKKDLKGLMDILNTVLENNIA